MAGHKHIHTYLPVLNIEEDESGRLVGRLDFFDSFNGTTTPDGADVDDEDRVSKVSAALDAYLKAHPALTMPMVIGAITSTPDESDG